MTKEIENIAESAAEKPVKEKTLFTLLSKYRGAIMGFSALWILFFHEWQKMAPEGSWLSPVEDYVKRIGFCGVDIFLFLSGIGLVYAIGKGSVLSFYYRRLKRVYLPFLIVGILRLILEHWEMPVFWKNVLCVNFYTTSMYSFLWFVPAILTLYLLFPLYWKLFSKASNKLLFTGAVFMIWMALSIFLNQKMRGDLYGFTNRIPVFIFGVHAGWLSKTSKAKFNGTTWFALLSFLAVGLYFAYLANFQYWGFIVPTSNCFLPNLMIAVSLPFVAAKLLDMVSSIPKIGVIGKLISGMLGFFGLFSLELYCVQEWLAGILFKKFPDATPLEKNLMIFGVAIAAGVALYLVVKYFWKLVDCIAGKVAAEMKKEKPKTEAK